jgi:hypothetical protein
MWKERLFHCKCITCSCCQWLSRAQKNLLHSLHLPAWLSDHKMCHPSRPQATPSMAGEAPKPAQTTAIGAHLLRQQPTTPPLCQYENALDNSWYITQVGPVPFPQCRVKSGPRDQTYIACTAYEGMEVILRRREQAPSASS